MGKYIAALLVATCSASWATTESKWTETHGAWSGAVFVDAMDGTHRWAGAWAEGRVIGDRAPKPKLAMACFEGKPDEGFSLSGVAEGQFVKGTAEARELARPMRGSRSWIWKAIRVRLDERAPEAEWMLAGRPGRPAVIVAGQADALTLTRERLANTRRLRVEVRVNKLSHGSEEQGVAKVAEFSLDGWWMTVERTCAAQARQLREEAGEVRNGK